MASSGRSAEARRDRRAVPTRLPLGSSARRLGFERRLWLWLWGLALPWLGSVVWLCQLLDTSSAMTALVLAGAVLVWSVATTVLMEGVVRPLQTLSNMVAAMREHDFSFRARGAMRGDSLGDLALEINRLAGAMQTQRNAARDALALADRVIGSMQSPVLAFDEMQRLRLLNASAERAFRVSMAEATGRDAEALGMHDLLSVEDQSIVTPERMRTPKGATPPRWSVRRSTFRLDGVPHTLIVLSDVAAALREEERIAWRRIIRVLSHEINNSLTPIKSLAGMLRSRPLRLNPEFHSSQDVDDLKRGLAMIEDRADSLNRFLQAYQQLSRLPSPQLRTVSISTAVERSALLERRVPIDVVPSPELQVKADPDQLQQLLINVLKNAAEAAADPELKRAAPQVEVSWRVHEGSALLRVTDNGPGLSNPANLFVPFYTTKPEGTGIGLTLCQQIVAAHHGSIALRNRDDGNGCLVEITLPLRDEA